MAETTHNGRNFQYNDQHFMDNGLGLYGHENH